MLIIKPSFPVVPVNKGRWDWSLFHRQGSAFPCSWCCCIVGSGAKCCPPPIFTLCLFPLQFPDIVDFCEKMANAGKTVIVAALDGTFQRKVKTTHFGTAAALGPSWSPPSSIFPAVWHRPLGASCTWCRWRRAW